MSRAEEEAAGVVALVLVVLAAIAAPFVITFFWALNDTTAAIVLAGVATAATLGLAWPRTRLPPTPARRRLTLVVAGAALLMPTAILGGFQGQDWRAAEGG